MQTAGGGHGLCPLQALWERGRGLAEQLLEMLRFDSTSANLLLLILIGASRKKEVSVGIPCLEKSVPGRWGDGEMGRGGWTWSQGSPFGLSVLARELSAAAGASRDPEVIPTLT